MARQAIHKLNEQTIAPPCVLLVRTAVQYLKRSIKLYTVQHAAYRLLFPTKNPKHMQSDENEAFLNEKIKIY